MWHYQKLQHILSQSQLSHSVTTFFLPSIDILTLQDDSKLIDRANFLFLSFLCPHFPPHTTYISQSTTIITLLCSLVALLFFSLLNKTTTLKKKKKKHLEKTQITLEFLLTLGLNPYSLMWLDETLISLTDLKFALNASL